MGRKADKQANLGPREQKPRPVATRWPLPAKLALLQGACMLALAARRSVSAAIAMANIGAALMYSGVRGDVRRPVRLLGAGIGASFAALDFRRGRPVSGAVLLAMALSWGGVQVRDALRARRRPEAAFA